MRGDDARKKMIVVLNNAIHSWKIPTVLSVYFVLRRDFLKKNNCNYDNCFVTIWSLELKMKCKALVYKQSEY